MYTLSKIVFFVITLLITSPVVLNAQTGDIPPQNTPQSGYYCPQITRDLFLAHPRMTDATTGGQVSELQRFLESYYDDYPEDSVTGRFGPTTNRFVIRFQQEQNLLPAFGYVGPKTRARIAQVCGGAGAQQSVPQTQPFQCPQPPVCTQGTAYVTGNDAHSCFVYACGNTSNTSGFDLHTCTFGGQIIAHGAGVLAYSAPTVSIGQTCASVQGTHTCYNGSFNDPYVFPSCSIQSTQQTYSWTAESWSSCVNGQQTRAVTCTNTQGAAVQDSFCTATKPVTTRSCTTTSQSCLFNGTTVADGSSIAAYNMTQVAAPDTCDVHKETRVCTNGNLSGSYLNAACTALTQQTNGAFPATIASDMDSLLQFYSVAFNESLAFDGHLYMQYLPVTFLQLTKTTDGQKNYYRVTVSANRITGDKHDSFSRVELYYSEGGDRLLYANNDDKDLGGVTFLEFPPDLASKFAYTYCDRSGRTRYGVLRSRQCPANEAQITKTTVIETIKTVYSSKKTDFPSCVVPGVDGFTTAATLAYGQSMNYYTTQSTLLPTKCEVAKVTCDRVYTEEQRIDSTVLFDRVPFYFSKTGARIRDNYFLSEVHRIHKRV